ncbi:Gfo/Idh/MocA family protein [Gracilimonas amylolytica]|uniref:Gfo/Idh/MocA family protein n=1 Tax=Gracilimonas amylolytica TaxID=1749045 RepID=UPI000CD91657|nr:Gfo/Idh/MocA family oxidoreductase [Gracilimonas amylolytica]
MSDKIKWGVLSTANIGIKHVIPAMQKGTLTEITAIASRDLERAEEAAQKLGIIKAYGNYDELLADDDIDAIYNPLPNHLHVPWTLKAIEAGKHVLCEKPIALNVSEVESLVEYSKKYPDIKVMEAFMYRFHPQWDIVKSWLSVGMIGTINSIQSAFCYFNKNEEDYRNHPEMGGGGLLDVGSYCISSARYIFESEPESILSSVDIDPEFGVDRHVSAVLNFPNGTATLYCSTQSDRYQNMTIYGSEGIIEFEIPFNPLEKEVKVSLIKGEKIIEQKKVQANHYTLQGDAFSEAILENGPVPTPLEDAVANMKVIDKILKAG